MVCGPASIEARGTCRSLSSSYCTSRGAKHSLQTCTGASGVWWPHSRQTRPEAGEPAKAAGASEVTSVLLIFPALSGTELAPGSGELVAGASSGRVPGAPRDEDVHVELWL